MKSVSVALILASSLAVLVTPDAHAQGGATSSISGVVSDAGGGVLPGATVVVASNATGTKFEAVTNNSGAYTVPALSAGVYTVTFSLPGFKTRAINDVRVQLAIPTTLNAALEIGAVAETITVSGAGAELINTITPAVTATGLTKKISIGGSKSIEFRADVLNVFNNINFTVNDASRTPGPGAGIFQTDSAYRDLDNTYDPGGRLGQLALRVNW